MLEITRIVVLFQCKWKNPSVLGLKPQPKEKAVNEKPVIEMFEDCDAIWMHDGNPKMPHAELTTGFCSNGYFDCRRVLMYPWLCRKLAERLCYKMVMEGITNYVHWSAGSSYSAITFSYELAGMFRVKHGFTEKDPLDPIGKKMIWKGGVIPPEERVLQIEELITTSHTLFEVRRAIQEANPNPVNFLPVVGCIVHRPKKLPVHYEGIKIISLIEKEIWTEKPENCPLCKTGSRRLRPRGNWKELTTGKK
ncbi:MAG: hypothetical protein A3A98_01990 [Candidatus Staskawiczbacteria bacterium RIFCSPLOWO2_01_FULL_40_39]|uniref:Uncharacterized protein n=1 Tax=Candidatus Staskawiczbacteria bacterium RIFCSPHIGHO2_01_FULL_39_25 TaxID=1802202 RepID=A0A1G2HQS0_9BACT|nr:MAG: hypothetical protein A2730_02145 [Candidatus Staskawiczbacteria bacterium RIFCSPHIGHO2_01_FULL_39_25]OGZ72737.1 MAG: hypothetical protein A3A98_01990 [Candidatus Staskawiczbacteria bacterium RIFCSPLOWO2_01_FULL_40_39]OGZ76761.1 MAG: hypothetical protein A3I87_02560 [Candidatus Staskawiczbacteria bacterium RIFCSPLOWO2_02_FULL_39_8]